MRRLIVAAVIMAVVLVAMPYPAKAIMTGNDLYPNLQHAQNSIEYQSIALYVIGVADGGDKVYFDIPPGVNATQLTDIVKKYLQSYPQLRHLRASDIVIRAISKSFPLNK